MAHVDHVRDWLKHLGALIAPSMTEQEFDGRINLLAPELAAEFPTEAYNQESCRAVARECRFFPNYAEACTHLSAWWRQHRFIPWPPPHTPAAEPAPRSEAELQHVSIATRRVVADLQAAALEREAHRAKAEPVHQTRRRQLTRAELNEAYRREGLKGPQVPADPVLRPAAADIRQPVRKGPVLVTEP